jgi:hypothetical protein
MGARERSKAYYEKYHASPEAKKDRAARNKARRKAIREGRVKKGDGKELDHKVPLSKGGSRSTSNTRVVDRYTNRSYKRDAKNRPV